MIVQKVFCWLSEWIDSVSARLPWTAEFFRKRPRGSKEFSSFFQKGLQHEDRSAEKSVLTEDRLGLAA